MISSTKDIVTNAISSGINMKFMDFVKFSKINLESFIIDKFFHNIRNDLAIYMSDESIEQFGYKGTIRKQKEKINDLIKDNFIEYKNKSYWIYNNDEYSKFLEERILLINDYSEPLSGGTDLYPPINIGNGKAKTKHIIIMPEMFKEMLMLCNTDKGKQVRKHYIKMVDTLHLYIEYQSKIELKSLTDKLDKLLITTELERQKADERDRIQNEKITQLLGFATETSETLKVVAKNQVEVSILKPDKRHTFIILKDNDVDSITPYYAIRSQNGSSDKIINNIRTRRNRSMSVFVELDQPNSVAFFNIIKSELCDNIERVGQWFTIVGMSEDEFKTKITDINRRHRRP